MLTLPVCGHEIVHNNGLRVTFSMIVWCYVLYSIKKVERERDKKSFETKM